MSAEQPQITIVDIDLVTADIRAFSVYRVRYQVGGESERSLDLIPEGRGRGGHHFRVLPSDRSIKPDDYTIEIISPEEDTTAGVIVTRRVPNVSGRPQVRAYADVPQPFTGIRTVDGAAVVAVAAVETNVTNSEESRTFQDRVVERLRSGSIIISRRPPQSPGR